MNGFSYHTLARKGRARTLSVCGVLAVAATLAAVAAASNNARASTASTGTLKVGINVALSGPGAFYGLPQLNAWKIVAAQYNKPGGIKVGERRYKIQLVSADNKWDPATIKQIATQQVIQDKVNIVATVGDPQDPVIVPVTERNHVVLDDWTANVFLVKKPNHYVLNGWPAAYVTAKPYYREMLKLHPGIKTVYGVGADIQYDKNNNAWDKASATSLGLKWLGTATYPVGQVDFTAILAPIVRAKPDMIALGSESSATPAILKTLTELGYKGVVGSDVPAEDLDADIAGAGSAADGFYQVEAFSSPNTPALAAFRAKYVRLAGKWNTLAATFWVDAQFVLKAMQKAGTVTNAAKIVAAGRKTTMADPLVPGSPVIRLGGAKTYGQVRELAMPVALNQAVNGVSKTQAILPIAIP